MASREFKLRSTATSATSHNIMILPSNLTIKDFTPPVRMCRDPNLRTDQVTGTDSNKKAPAIAAGRATKIKTRIIRDVNQREEEEANDDGVAEGSSMQESAPWVLEDFDGQHTLQGRLEGGIGSTASRSGYVFFVNQGSDFKVVPADRWYRFHPRLPFQPMSLEEAEEAMSQRNVDRWAMKRKRNLAADEEEEDLSEKRGLKRLLWEATNEATTLPRRPPPQTVQPERIDFDEIFDDDEGDDVGEGAEGGEDGDDFDPSMPRPTLSKAGRKVRKLLNHDDGEVANDEDDERDPYALSGEGEEEEDAEEEIGYWKPKQPLQPSISVSPPSQPQSQTSQVLSQSQTLQQPLQFSSQVLSQTSQQPLQSQQRLPTRLSPTQTPRSSPQNSSATPPASPKPSTLSPLITEGEIIAILRQGPCSTKELIRQLRNKLKADPANKDIFRSLVKRLATLLPGGSEEDRLLELKPEFR